MFPSMSKVVEVVQLTATHGLRGTMYLEVRRNPAGWFANLDVVFTIGLLEVVVQVSPCWKYQSLERPHYKRQQFLKFKVLGCQDLFKSSFLFVQFTDEDVDLEEACLIIAYNVHPPKVVPIRVVLEEMRMRGHQFFQNRFGLLFVSISDHEVDIWIIGNLSVHAP